MSNEIKEYLDSASFKFKEVDENGTAEELTLSEVIQRLINENKQLAELCNKYEEEHNTTFKEWQKDIQANKKAIEELKQAYTDICNNDNANYIHIAFRNDLLNILEGKNEYNK